MDELAELTRRVPRWLVLLFGAAFAGAALQALLSGAVETPAGQALFRSQIDRAESPGAYWSLVLAYAAVGAFFIAAALRRYRTPTDEHYEPAPEAPRPRGVLRGLAWLGVAAGVLLVAAGIAAHFTMDPLIGLFFVLGLCGGGLAIGLPSAGYLITGRLQ